MCPELDRSATAVPHAARRTRFHPVSQHKALSWQGQGCLVFSCMHNGERTVLILSRIEEQGGAMPRLHWLCVWTLERPQSIHISEAAR